MKLKCIRIIGTGVDMEIDLEQTAKQLVSLAREDDLSPPDHQRAKALMRELRKMAMTNAQISELTEGRWAETTIKEYTRGVTVMDSQRWQGTTALFGEMVSKGLTTEDVKETIAVRDNLSDCLLPLLDPLFYPGLLVSQPTLSCF
ncbi:hypothetical protein ES703_104668 [subsurface metagenome]